MVNESATVIPFDAFNVRGPVLLIPPVVAPRAMEPAEEVMVVPLTKFS